MSNVTYNNIEMVDSIKRSFDRIDGEINETSEDIPIDFDEGGVITQEYFEKVCEELNEMNFLELQKTYRHLKVNRDELVSAKRTADQLIEMKKNLEEAENNNDALTNAIIEANAETEAGTDNIETFLKSYDSTMDKLEKLIQRAEDILHKFDEQEKTTSFLTENMLTVLNKNIKRLDLSNDSSLKNIKIFYKVLYEIFTNRASTTFLVKVIEDQKIFVTRLHDSINKDKSGSHEKLTKEMIDGTFSDVFNSVQLEAIGSYLEKLFGDKKTVFYLQYALAHFYSHEKSYGKYGKHKWVEVMYMNIIDICTDMYDLEGGKEYYEQQLLNLKDVIKNFLK